MGVPFGRYELLERVAVGGMAEVFRARSVGRDGFSKEVCIKRILPGFCQEQDFVRMFIDEATLVARLQHANIVQIFDFDQVDGAYYIAMEFVNGRDLRNVIRLATQHQFPLGPFRSAVIAAEVCKGLHYAHQKDGIGLVHRDVSPHNVLLSHDGDVKVMDFGIAKAADRITRTSTGIIKGKIAYMAPEQAAAAVLDHRVDQFATGLVLFEMLTGRRAFDGPDAMALRRALSGEVEPPSLVSKEVPPELDEIFLRATRRNPEDRYPDMRAFERALLQFVYGRNLTEQDLDLAAYMRGLSDRVGAPTRTRVQEAMPEPSPVAPTVPAPRPLLQQDVATRSQLAAAPAAVVDSAQFNSAPTAATPLPTFPPGSQVPLTVLDATHQTPSELTQKVRTRSGAAPGPAATSGLTDNALYPPPATPQPEPRPTTGDVTHTLLGGLAPAPTAPAPLAKDWTAPAIPTRTVPATQPTRAWRAWVLGFGAVTVTGGLALFGMNGHTDPPAPSEPPAPRLRGAVEPGSAATAARVEPAPDKPAPVLPQPPAPTPAQPRVPASRVGAEAELSPRRGRVLVSGGGIWAEVLLRGKRVLEETPGALDLEPGRYTLVFRNPETGRTANVNVVVKAGGTVRVANPLR